MNPLERLLQSQVPTPQTKQFRHKRLSEICGGDVIFTLREIGFSKVAEIQKLHAGDGEMDVHTVLATTVEPDFRNKELLEKYGAATPAELVKKMLRPGEITDLARQGEILSGFRVNTLESLEDLEKK